MILIQCHKDLVKIVRWDLSNYHALKAGWKTVETTTCFGAFGRPTGHHQNISAELVRILCHEVIGNWAEPSSDLMTTSRSSCTQLRLLISETKRAQLYDESISLFGSHPEAGRYGVVTRNDRRRPWKSWSTRWGWNFVALKRNSWGWPMA